jgi:hypothetical protein
LADGAVLGFTSTVALADGAALALALGAALTATPLPQTNLLPFFTHVYVIPPAVLTCPAFLHAAPAATAADEPGATTTDKSKAIPTLATIFLIGEDY